METQVSRRTFIQTTCCATVASLHGHLTLSAEEVRERVETPIIDLHQHTNY